MFDQDQAAGLRALFARERPDVVVAFGAGIRQATLLAALARSTAREGAGVLLIDGSAGLAAEQLGLRCRYELGHVLAGDKTLAQVVRVAEPGLTVLPALRGLDLLAGVADDVARGMRQQFGAMFDKKGAQIDAILVNSRPLAAARALDAFSARAHLLLVLEPGIEGLTAAYQEIKTLSLAHRISSCDVVLADATRSLAALSAFERLQQTTYEFLGVTLNLQSRKGVDVVSLSENGKSQARHHRSEPLEVPRGITC